MSILGVIARMIVGFIMLWATTTWAEESEDRMSVLNDNESSSFVATSVLIAPVVNHSIDVDAPNFMLSTLTIPMAARGYYVFPVNTTKVVLEQEGFYEADMVHAQDPGALAALFGADAILYVVINRWDAQYVIFSTEVTVDFSYRLVNKFGTELWSATKQMQYKPDRANSGNALGNLLANAIVAAIDNTAPRYMSLAKKANDIVFRYSPTGPYYPRKNR